MAPPKTRCISAEQPQRVSCSEHRARILKNSILVPFLNSECALWNTPCSNLPYSSRLPGSSHKNTTNNNIYIYMSRSFLTRHLYLGSDPGYVLCETGWKNIEGPGPPTHPGFLVVDISRRRMLRRVNLGTPKAQSMYTHGLVIVQLTPLHQR